MSVANNHGDRFRGTLRIRVVLFPFLTWPNNYLITSPGMILQVGIWFQKKNKLGLWDPFQMAFHSMAKNQWGVASRSPLTKIQLQPSLKHQLSKTGSLPTPIGVVRCVGWVTESVLPHRSVANPQRINNPIARGADHNSNPTKTEWETHQKLTSWWFQQI